jgi:hypothetical protein
MQVGRRQYCLTGPATHRGSLQVMIGAIPCGAGASHCRAAGRQAFCADKVHKNLSYGLILLGFIISSPLDAARALPAGVSFVLPLASQMSSGNSSCGGAAERGDWAKAVGVAVVRPSLSLLSALLCLSASTRRLASSACGLSLLGNRGSPS